MEYVKNSDGATTIEALLSREEVAKLLQINKVTLWRYTRENRIPHYRVGKKMLFKKSEVLEAIKVK